MSGSAADFTGRAFAGYHDNLRWSAPALTDIRKEVRRLDAGCHLPNAARLTKSPHCTRLAQN
jgi:hypothetical protein